MPTQVQRYRRGECNAEGKLQFCYERFFDSVYVAQVFSHREPDPAVWHLEISDELKILNHQWISGFGWNCFGGLKIITIYWNFYVQLVLLWWCVLTLLVSMLYTQCGITTMLKWIVHPKLKNLSFITPPLISFQIRKIFVHKLRYFWWNPSAFWPCIDSNVTDKDPER